MKVDREVLEVLALAETDGPALRLVGQLERPLYVKANKVLEAAGGRWNRKAQAHLFDGSADEAIETVLLTGEIVHERVEFGFFPTRPAVVSRLVELAELRAGMRVLEPSAGSGAIAGPLAAAGHAVDCVEIRANDAEALRSVGFGGTVVEADFLAIEPTAVYDRVVMNPPFARRQDVRHVLHALQFLKPEGRLVSVMSNGAVFRGDRLTTEFRALVDARGGWFEELDPDAFKESGTGVRTVVVVLPAIRQAASAA